LDIFVGKKNQNRKCGLKFFFKFYFYFFSGRDGKNVCKLVRNPTTNLASMTSEAAGLPTWATALFRAGSVAEVTAWVEADDMVAQTMQSLKGFTEALHPC
jgi:hypothetical protein